MRLTHLVSLALIALFGSVCTPSAVAQTPPIPETAEANQALAGFLREQLLKNMPDPLFRNNRDWEHQKEVIVGLKFNRLKPEAQRAPRNNGLWHRLTLQPIDVAKSLKVGIAEVKSPVAGRTTFVAMIGLDVRATAEQQLWKSGVRLYGGETRARAKAAVCLECELTNRLDRPPGQLIPDALVRLKVTKAEVFYQDLVVEHTAGLDGDQAKRVGNIAQNLLKLFKPDLEREALERANAAIVKAGDTKEIRIEFQKLLGLVKP